MLPDDVCRCNDELCDERWTCKRWVFRRAPGRRVVNAWSLYPLPGPDWQPQMLLDRAIPCPNRIPRDAGHPGGGHAATERTGIF